MKNLIVAIATGLAFTGQWVPLVAAAQASQTKEASSAAAPNVAEFDRQLAHVQELMKSMQAQMALIRKTQDTQERQRLLQQHRATMQSAMTAMHRLWGPGMMGGRGMTGGGGMMGPGMMGGGWGRMGDYYSNLTPEQVRRRQYMTDQYLDMQQQMMNNMMWNQQYWMGPPAPTK
ncbi:hypothetical protein PQQ53_19715 [Paraburkholderia strydomiana]|uniref:hypothetical protein n=1 Tax=Paraburkholderia strydomiana TaxID=1245417 RepID=UPI0038BA926D